jgi:hypothetical protein
VLEQRANNMLATAASPPRRRTAATSRRVDGDDSAGDDSAPPADVHTVSLAPCGYDWWFCQVLPASTRATA